MDNLLNSLSWAAFDSGESAAVTPTETSFIQRLSFTQPLEGAEWIRQDAVGMLSSGDLESAVLAARLALDRAVDALLASHGEIEAQPKW